VALGQFLGRQAPWAQRSLAPQRVPQVPQLASSSRGSAQALPQRVLPGAQPHAPLVHVVPAGQTTPTHARSVQVPRKHTESGSQSAAGQSCGRQAPWVHRSVARQATPQVPQFASSDDGSAQAPPQLSRPDAHTHCPRAHWNPVGHSTPTQDLSVHTSAKQTDEGSHAVEPHEVG
jgi:hypothetical protein